MAYGKGWPGGVWEEGGASSGSGVGREGGGGGPLGRMSGGRSGKEAREMYLIQFPEDEEHEEEMVEDKEGEGCLSGEGEETADIKEEVRE